MSGKSGKSILRAFARTRAKKYDDIFHWIFHQKSNLIKFDPFWSILDISDSIWSKKKWKNENLMIYFNDYFIRNWKCGKKWKIWKKRWESQSDQVWSILIHFGHIWLNLIKKEMKKWKSDDIFQWLFHQKLKICKKWKIWLNMSGKGRKAF